MASVAMAPGMFLAQSVVPSSGSTAMSTFGPDLVPTFSPMNSIGASSISPSPMTTVPSIAKPASSRRMASTAAWSDCFSAPRPRRRAAATAARSVTRTISSDSARPRICCRWPGLDGMGTGSLVLLYPDDLRAAGDNPIAANRSQRLAHRILAGRVCNHDDGHRLARTARLGGAARSGSVALNDRLQRYILLRQPPRDGRRGAGPVAGQEPD